MGLHKNDIFNESFDSESKIKRFWREVWRNLTSNANFKSKIMLFIAIVVGVIIYFDFVRAPSNFPSNNLISISEGMNISAIAKHLEDNNVIRSATFFEWIVRLYGADKKMFAGDYIFKHPVSVFEVVKRIRIGAYGLDPVVVRVPAGGTVKDIASILEEKMIKFDKEEFVNVANKYEGYLFPDTYYFLPNASPNVIVGTMVDNFFDKYEEVKDDAEKTGLTLHEFVTLASIVELEAWKYEDRRKIAGVLLNRLDIDMPLQVDVSFVYLMNKGTFQVTKSDMKNQSPYNTYVHKGLPPGPLGSPSLSAMRATANPADRDKKWLFYLADKDGTTYFSKTYEQHLALKRKYIDNR